MSKNFISDLIPGGGSNTITGNVADGSLDLIPGGGIIKGIMGALSSLIGGGGSNTEIGWRAQQMKDRPVDSPGKWPPKDGTFLDFFVNFIDDYKNMSVPVGSNGGRPHPEWIAALFTPAEWNAVVNKVEAALPMIQGFAPDWNVQNVRLNRYEYLVFPWLQQNQPQIAQQLIQAAQDAANNTGSDSTGGTTTPPIIPGGQYLPGTVPPKTSATDTDKTPPPAAKKDNTLLIVLIVVVVLAAIGAIMYKK